MVVFQIDGTVVLEDSPTKGNGLLLLPFKFSQILDEDGVIQALFSQLTSDLVVSGNEILLIILPVML